MYGVVAKSKFGYVSGQSRSEGSFAHIGNFAMSLLVVVSGGKALYIGAPSSSWFPCKYTPRNGALQNRFGQMKIRRDNPNHEWVWTQVVIA